MLAAKSSGNSTVQFENRMEPPFCVKVRLPSFNETAELFLSSSKLKKVADHGVVKTEED